MPFCFAPRCASGYNSSKCHLFTPHSSAAQQWVSILSKIREDKIFDPRNKSHRLCDKHFEKHLLVTNDSFVIDGKEVLLERKHWALVCDALPTLFPSLPIYRQGRLPIKRKTRNICEQNAKRIKNDTEASYLEKCVTQWNNSNDNNWVGVFNSEDTNTSACFTNSRLSRTVKISENLELAIKFKEVSVNSSAFEVASLNNFDNDMNSWIKNLLTTVQNLNECKGVSGYNKVNTLLSGIKKGEVWFSNNCHVLDAGLICLPCKLIINNLKTSLERSKSEVPKILQKNLAFKNKLKYQQKRIKLLSIRNASLKMTTKVLRQKLVKIKVDVLSQILQKIQLPRMSKSSILHAVKMAKLKSAKGMRYEKDWILECLLLKIKSPAAYIHLRQSKILPLPHPRTLQHLLSGEQGEFGFSETAFKAIETELFKKPQSYRQGMIMFDEMKLRETLNFNKGTMKFDGFIDYSEYSDELLNENQKTVLADHALVLIYRPLNANWIQPIGAFATKGAAKGNALQKLILEAIIRLEKNGAEVVCVTADGAKSNKNFWKRFGISGQRENVRNKIIHPCSNKRNLYFICDVPHIFKCIRNHCSKYRTVKFDGKEVNYNYYDELYQEDQKRNGGLRKCPKLTNSHINPNSFEKMKVSLATQLFSRSVATGLKFYRELEKEKFKGSECTELFTNCMNTLYDAVNGKLPCEGLNLTTSGYTCIKKFLEVLKKEDEKDENGKIVKTNSFASTETMNALRVTLNSILELTEYLIIEKDYSYVLPNKLNQDPLERFFGLLRAAGGQEDHPTVSNFLQLYRILSLYTPIKRVTTGNITGANSETVLVSFQDSLRNNAKSKRKKHKEWKTNLDTLIHKKFFNAKLPENSSQTLDNADKNIVYYLCGYMVHKVRKSWHCCDCLLTIQAKETESFPNCVKLSLILDYGKELTYPSLSIFNLISNHIEPHLVKMLKNNDLYGDIIFRVMDQIGKLSLTGIGCGRDMHGFSLMCKLIPFYIIFRMHFYSRSLRNSLGHGKATRKQRKLSKLTST